MTGRLYEQFAVTIAFSVILSAFNALILSPALAALLLRPKTSSVGPLKGLFGWFNRGFANATEWYVRVPVRRWNAGESLGVWRLVI
jgi:multidrug efflux pump